jgi:flagellar M-ring protein FliF
MNDLLNRLREQFTVFWNRQGRFQRTALIALVVIAVIVIPLVITWATTPTYAVAFSKLSEEDAGKIVQSLKDKGITYQLRDSSTILVPADKVYDVRLTIANEGLPSGSTIGFEIFGQNTLGMTEFTQKVNYQRALEGELARTIQSLEAVQKAQVHLVTPERTLLEEDQQPTTASITIQEKPGQHLDAAQVRSITHLVASSVQGLKPESVVVVDVNGNLLSAGNIDGGKADASTEVDSRRAAELSYSRDLQNKVQKLLDSAFGPGKAVVQAYITLDWTARETKSQVYDPNTQVLRSSQKIGETYDAYGQNQGGVAGAIPNLPPGVTDNLKENQFAGYNRSEDINNYEVSMVETKENLTPGIIKNISLSVLVDGITDEADLAKIKSVVSAAAGIDLARGDKIAVETLDFDRTYATKQTQAETEQNLMDLYVKIGTAAAALLVILAVLLFVQRLLRNLRAASAEAWTPILQPVTVSAPELAPTPIEKVPQVEARTPVQELPSPPSPAELLMGLSEAPRIEKEESMPQIELPQPEVWDEGPAELELTDLLGRYAEEAPSVEDQQMQQVIIQLAEESPASVAEIIQMWLSEDEHGAGL